MNLKDFIKIALTDIVSATEEAKIELDTQLKSICPPIGQAYATKFGIQLDDATGMYHQQVTFDVAVTVEHIAGDNAKAGIKVFNLVEANLGKNSSVNNSTVSRIKFHVPIGLSCRRKQP